MVFDALWAAKLAVCLFLAVLFVQSGLDKFVDRRGNLEWLTSHFANSPLKGVVSPMLAMVTVVELLAGLASLAGAVGLVVPSVLVPASIGPALACLALLMLFFGQRIAKDYAGAATLAAYFGVALLGLVVCGATRLP